MAIGHSPSICVACRKSNYLAGGANTEEEAGEDGGHHLRNTVQNGCRNPDMSAHRHPECHRRVDVATGDICRNVDRRKEREPLGQRRRHKRRGLRRYIWGQHSYIYVHKSREIDQSNWAKHNVN